MRLGILSFLAVIVSLFAVSNGYATFVISPSSDISSCQPVSKCFTLSQFASNAIDYLSKNTTLIMMPGNHTLDVNFNISGVKQVSIKPMLKGTVNIKCTQGGYLVVNNVGTIEIQDTLFTHCVDNRFSHVDNVILSRAVFHGPSLRSNGTAITFNNTTALVSNCLFSLYLYGSMSFSQGKTSMVGGALIALNSSVTIAESMFKENRAQFGGALYTSQSRVVITGSVFDFNTANSSHSSTPASGGALCAVNSTVVINDTTLTNNNVYYGHALGGAIAVTNTTMVMMNSLISDNRALDAGGAVHATYSRISIVNCSCTKNKASLSTGGAFAISYTMLTVVNSFVRSNQASTNGGAIHALNSVVVIRDSSVYHNFAQQLGGVVFANSSAISIRRSILSGNTATTDGGGIYCFENCRIKANLSIFDRNGVQQNGGVVSVNRRCLITFKDCEFVNNSATSGGVVSTGTANMITIVSSLFQYNMAYGTGGVISAKETAVYVSNSTFMNNGAHIGGIFQVDNSSVVAFTSLFANNSASRGSVMTTEASNATFMDILVTRCVGKDVFLFKSSNVTFKNHTRVLSNKGGIAAINSTLSFTGESLFNHNSRLTSNGLSFGGAISLFYSILNFDGVHRFINNSALKGGAISAYMSEIKNSGQLLAFGNNAMFGGALYLNVSQLQCNGYMYYMNNYAMKRGGGIDAINSSMALNSNCSLRFDNNVAGAGNDIVIDSI